MSVIILNLNGTNTSIKRQRLAESIKKYDLTTYCPQDIHFSFKTTNTLKVNVEKSIPPKHNQKRAKDKICCKSQRRALYRNKSLNPLIIHRNYEHTWTSQQNLKNLWGKNWQNSGKNRHFSINGVGNLNILLSKMVRTTRQNNDWK